MSGRWRTRSDGRLTGKSAGSASRSRSKSGGVQVDRRPPGQHRERVARDVHLLAQRRQQRAVARELAARGLDVELGRDAGIHLGLDQPQIGLVVGDDALDGRDLRAERGDGERLDHGVAGEGEIGGVELEILRVGERLALLDRAARGAPQSSRIADRGADAEDVGIGREAAAAASSGRTARR